MEPMARRHHFLGDALAGGWLGGRMSQIGSKELGDRMGLPSARQAKKARRRAQGNPFKIDFTRGDVGAQVFGVVIVSLVAATMLSLLIYGMVASS